MYTRNKKRPLLFDIMAGRREKKSDDDDDGAVKCFLCADGCGAADFFQDNVRSVFIVCGKGI